MVEPVVFGIVVGLTFITALGLLVVASCHWLGLTRLTVMLTITGLLLAENVSASTFPAFAVALTTEPRSASGKFVCANCHLLGADVQLSLPQAVFRQSVFDVWCRVPTRRTNAQVRSDGTVGALQLGRVIVFPETVTVEPIDGWTGWSSSRSIWWSGPIGSKVYASEALSVRSDEFTPGTYTVYLGANRGRGQVYPSGESSNLAPARSPIDGLIKGITFQPKRFGSNVWLAASGSDHLIHAPAGIVLEPSIFPRAVLHRDEAFTQPRNFGGFGVSEQSLTLQSPERLQGEVRLLLLLVATQVMLVLKKKQFERLNL